MRPPTPAGTREQASQTDARLGSSLVGTSPPVATLWEDVRSPVTGHPPPGPAARPPPGTTDRCHRSRDDD